jgi:dienelactone hydrolase
MFKKMLTLISLLAVVLLTGCAVEPLALKHYGANEHFSNKQLEQGTFSTKEECTKEPNSLWVETAKGNDCIKYYPSSNVGATDSVIIFMSGDYLSGTPGHQYAEGVYSTNTPAKLLIDSEKRAKKNGVPYINLARPGTLGSSGIHNNRRRQIETLEMNEAITQLKAKYHFTKITIVGQSGGGGLVGALVAERSDITCAIAASGVLSVKMRANQIGGEPVGIPFSEMWDPVEHIASAKPMTGFRMFVLSSRWDSTVPFVTQTHFAEVAKAAGLNVTQIQMQGNGSTQHNLKGKGVKVAAECSHGLSTEEIITRNQEK